MNLTRAQSSAAYMRSNPWFFWAFPSLFRILSPASSFVLVNSMVNSMGLLSSAGYGIAVKVVNFIMLIPSAFMQAMSAFVAQNMGAGKAGSSQKGSLSWHEDSAVRRRIYVPFRCFWRQSFIGYFLHRRPGDRSLSQLSSVVFTGLHHYLRPVLLYGIL